VENVEKHYHLKLTNPAILATSIIFSCFGAIIGMELITRLGITTNTSIVGVLGAILISFIPIARRTFGDIHAQNLLQTAISASTFVAGNSVLLPMATIWFLGRTDLVIPMFIGVALAAAVDMTMMYWLFDTRIFPAKGAWPPGIASAEAILAAAKRGKDALYFLGGIFSGAILRYFFAIPADVLGVAWIGNIWALTMFGVGLTIRGYLKNFTGIDVASYYVPHGLMIGGATVAVIQILLIIRRGQQEQREKGGSEDEFTRPISMVPYALSRGVLLYTGIAVLLAILCGFYTEMSLGMLVLWIIYALIAAFVSEIIVGLSAMHSGWFPTSPTALLFLIIGVLIGFPPIALGILVGYTGATGAAFADMGYDLKTGWILRGEGKDKQLELEGRRQQYFAELLGWFVASLLVIIAYRHYFEAGLIPPHSRVFITTIEAGRIPGLATKLLIWAIPGAILQAIGGPERQLGILLATGMLIYYPIAGLTVLAGIIIRAIIVHKYKDEGQRLLYVIGAGCIAGSTIVSFFTSTLKLGKK